MLFLKSILMFVSVLKRSTIVVFKLISIDVTVAAAIVNSAKPLS